MQALIHLLSRRRLVVMIGFVLLLLLTWIVGWWWLRLDIRICFGITLVILVIWVLLLMFERIAAERGANLLEQSIKAQSEDQAMGLRPEKREEVEHLRQQLNAAIEALKKSKLGKGRSGKSALYALPWYMIIGPPAAGKTTAIKNSGLEFPFGADREIQGVGGTRNCDWWFSNSAILLDTAGRYTTEEEDREEWSAFLDILKKHRRRQPVNGILIGISIADLLNASPDELEWHAKNIRKRMDELVQRLGIRFPVYLIFTKCDLLNGFVEFFEEYSRVQRQQVWGCTFSKEQLVNANPAALFEQEFNQLYNALVSLRLAQLTPALKRENRRLVFAFPMQFATAKESLAHLIGKLFQPNPYQESPIFRGFYFTSGTQEGVPIDRVLQSIASAYGLPPEATGQFSPEMKTKSYFIRDLFTDIIIPDEQLGRLTSRVERRRRVARLGTLVASVVVLLLFGLGILQAYFASKSNLEELSREIAAVKWKSVDSVSPPQRLGKLLTRIQELQDRPFFSFGMDRSTTVLPWMRALYYKELRPFVRKNVLGLLEDRLRRSGSQGGGNYDNLKAYLLLTSEVDRLRESADLKTFMRSKLTGLADPTSPPFLKEHFEFFASDFAEAVAESLVAPFPAERSLVTSARAVAGTFNVENVYERLKGRAVGLTPVSVSDRSLRSTHPVPGLFTKAGADAMEKLIEEELIDPGTEAKWVLGVHDQQVMTSAPAREKMTAALKDAYFREYAAEWWKFLAGLDVEPFADVAVAADQIRRLSSLGESPLLLTFKTVVEQTTFESSLEAGIRDKAAGAGVNVGSQHPVDRQFAAFHQLVLGSADQKTASDLNALLSQLAKVADAFDVLKDAPQKNTKDYAAKVVKGEPTELTSGVHLVQEILKARDSQTHEAMRGILEKPYVLAWRTVLNVSLRYLNDEWKRIVVDPYSQLAAGVFPFDSRSTREASLGDVAQIFSPTGRLAAFVEGELRPFLADGDTWEPRLWEGIGLDLSLAAREGLRAASFLAQSIFHGGAVGVTVEIKMEQPILTDDSPNFDRVCLSIGSQDHCFSWKKDRFLTTRYEWPGPESGRGAGIRLINDRFILGESLVDSMNAEGDWGFFRLLARAEKLQGSTRAEFRYRWLFKQGIVIPCVVKAETSTYNPFSRGLGVKLPDQLN
jgi:type VI secretion system protein ImpL